MSARLVSAVFASALPAWLKPYATACANFANDDGSSVYPSIARLAQMVGRCERATQTAIRELRRRGILTLKAPPGRHRATRYHFHVRALPRPQAMVKIPEGIPIRRGDFHKHPQALTGSGLPVMGAVDCTRSVNDLSVRTNHLRARETDNGKRPKGKTS